MMTLLVMVLILVGVIFFMAVPFFRPEEAKAIMTAYPDGELPALFLEKEAAYAAIKDLDFDHLMGKLSDEDYRSLQSKYEFRAIDVLKKIEKSDGHEAIEQEIEKNLKQIKERRRAAALKDSPDGATVAVEATICAQCGASLKLGAKFCAKCGAQLKTSCKECGFEAEPRDKFCSGCGAKLS